VHFFWSEDVKAYILLQPHSNQIIIRKDVKIDEYLSTCEPNSVFDPSSSYIPSLMFVRYALSNFYVSDPILVYSSYDDSEDENIPLNAHLPLVESIEHELALALQLPRSICTT
jgi:hypothetical protein